MVAAARGHPSDHDPLPKQHRLSHLDDSKPRLRLIKGGAAAFLTALLVAGCGSGRTTHPSHSAPSTIMTTARHELGDAAKQTGRLATQGSLGGVPVPFAHQEFRVANMFLGNRGANYSVGVYAGYAPSAPDRGSLRVVWIDNRIGTPDDTLSGTFIPPGHLGRIHIVAVRGDTVVFASKTHRGIFNLVTHRFQ